MNDITSFSDISHENGCEAFSRLYSEVYQDLYRYCLYFLCNREEAEDAVQETALSAYKAINSLKNIEAFRPWIFKIASRKCKNRIGLLIQKRNQIPLDFLDYNTHPSITPELENAIAIAASIQKLSAEERQIILLSIILGYNSREISSILKKPEGTIRSKLSRSLKKIRMDLEKE